MPWLFCQEAPFLAKPPVVHPGLKPSAQNVTNREFSLSLNFTRRAFYGRNHNYLEARSSARDGNLGPVANGFFRGHVAAWDETVVRRMTVHVEGCKGWKKVVRRLVIGRAKGEWEVSRSLLAFGWYNEAGIRMFKAHSLYRLKGRWIGLPDLLLASKWIHLIDPIALPCNSNPKTDFWAWNLASHRPTQTKIKPKWSTALQY